MNYVHVHAFDGAIDAATANTVEFWMHENRLCAQTVDARAERLAQERSLVEATLRTVPDRDAAAFRAGLAELHPGAKGRIVCVILLSKLARNIRTLHRPDVACLPLDARTRHPGQCAHVLLLR